ncbi:MAG: DNA-binding protein [Candidatus Devosia euplotis]|nr:DNA-binding protein [Candidatus Devosia euplotis]
MAAAQPRPAPQDCAALHPRRPAAGNAIGKAYRISRARLNVFAGIGERAAAEAARATCIVDIPQMSAERAQRTVLLLGAAAMSGDAGTPVLELKTAFDPGTASLKVIMIGVPSDVASLLQLLQLKLQSQP